jgi:hypothetical protein
MVVDGIDFRIQEIRKYGFNPRFHSHKFHKAALKYEVATCINTGEVVWIHGPFPGGRHDLTIYRAGLKQQLRQGEMIWADGSYRGDATCVTKFQPGLSEEFLFEIKRARSRHETVNGRFTDWSALRDVYRHSPNKHHLIFYAVVMITNIEMYHGFCPFQCFSSHDSALLAT